ncbi:exo-beta-N-acetylmuramidase NamZ domain-containing protein [Hymenobacter rubripertinctus]|uniref:exo-beta-N-acetylmuramidase NamZ family protein n=1 Tax=Hymenobacter rubripertinctus TaxID=2029981 RepID=UPI003625D979
MSSFLSVGLISLSVFLADCTRPSQSAPAAAPDTTLRQTVASPPQVLLPAAAPLQVGAAQFDKYLPLLRGKRVGLVVNQTARVGAAFLVDTLLTKGVAVKVIFGPEHGFRGEAADGATIKDGKDARSGLPALSLYGATKKPTPEMLRDVDVLVFDIQDVGARFYTFISTMHYVMEAAAEQNKEVIILDRPNPNGWYVDGPVLEPKYKTFVGMHPIPVVHGLTVGELAQMINGEKWLAGGRQCRLTVIPVAGYTHATRYALPVRPSPNLPTPHSVDLYPSLCLFEGTDVSVGRGTDRPFELIGAPTQPASRPFSFVPRPNPGSTTPPQNGQRCYGQTLEDVGEIGFTLSYLIDYYNQSTDKAHFFTSGFERLMGTADTRRQIIAGQSEADIRASWEPALGQYKALRKKYLLYPDFN